MATKIRDEDWHEPERDQRGRFRRGSSGNPNGRPRRAPTQPWSLSRRVAQALSKEIPVTADGKTEMMQVRDLIIESLVRALPKAKPKDIVHVMKELLTLVGPDQDEEDSGCWTDEDRRLLESIQAKYMPTCSRCGKEMSDELPEEPDENVGLE